MEENKIVIYKDENNSIQLDVKLDNGMIWVTRQQLATLFGRDYKTISKHINNALKEELADEVVVAKFASTTQHGAMEGKTQTHEVEFFNLEMVTSVGYRVKSNRGVQNSSSLNSSAVSGVFFILNSFLYENNKGYIEAKI